MSVYARFKKDPDGFRKLVELLETTPMARRQKMIDVGMREDPLYTQRALELMMTFEDVLGLPDLELAEVVAAAPPRMLAFAICRAGEDIHKRFLANAQPKIRTEIRDYLLVNAGPREIGGAQFKVIEVARQLERRGRVSAKKIPK